MRHNNRSPAGQVNKVGLSTTIFAMLTILMRSIYGAGFPLVGDTLWQTRDGQDQLARSSPTWLDTWSWTAYNTEWISNSWLWNKLLGWIASFTYPSEAFVLLTFILTVLFFLLAWAVLSFAKITPWVKLLALILLEIGTISWLSLRPQIMDYILMLAFLLAVLVITRALNVPLPAQITLLAIIAISSLVVWQNLHLTAILGVLFYAICVIIFLQAEYWVKALSAMIIVSLGLVALFLTPYGGKAVGNITSVSAEAVGFITEWSNVFYYKNLVNVFLVLGVACCVGFVGLLLLRKHWLWAGIMIVAALIPTVYAVRFIPYSLIAGVVMLIAAELGSPHKNKEIMNEKIERWWVAVLSFGSIMAMILSLLAFSGVITKIQENDIMEYGDAEFASIPPDQRVFSDIVSAGAIILSRPDLKVIMDGRVELWGQDYLEYLRHLMIGLHGKEKFMECIDQENINVVVLKRGVITVIPRYLSDWEKVSTEHYFIYLRPDFLPVPSATTGSRQLLCNQQS